MRRSWLLVLAAVVAVNLVGLSASPTAQARAKYSTAFRKAYVKKGTPMYDAIKGKDVCNACHVGGEKERAMLNGLGEAMSEFLPDADVMDANVIGEALQQAVAKPSGDDGSPTFAELIETGKLPITEKAE
jgi:hypothetical protein